MRSCKNTESRLLSQGERYGEKVEVASQFFVTKYEFLQIGTRSIFRDEVAPLLEIL